MAWIFMALTAHFANAFVFVVDKGLLGGTSIISRPVRYAFYSALLAGLAVVLLPFAYVPITPFIAVWSAVSGGLHIGALWLFFSSLRSGEASRVAPLAGSAVPFFTLLFAVFFLGEVLEASHFLAVIFLIAGGTLLSVRFAGIRGMPPKAALLAIISGIFFAGYFAVVKHMYDHAEPFLAVFAYGRVIEALLALVVLGPFAWKPARKVASGAPAGTLKGKLFVPAVFVGNKALAAGAFLLQSYAISLGSVTIVNALQGTQYVFLLAIASGVSYWRPRILQEELRTGALFQKISGILFVGLGLLFLL